MRTVVHTKVFRLRLADSTGAGHCRTFLPRTVRIVRPLRNMFAKGSFAVLRALHGTPC